jgi:pantetheine-phosphate adenylyltransferase
MHLAVYPGSFDPLTLGHVNIIERASRLAGSLVVAVVRNPKKQSLFSLSERQEMITDSCAHVSNISVDSFEGLLVEYLKSLGGACVIKGLRNGADFEGELQMASLNAEMWAGMESVFLPATPKLGHYSSTMVREIAALGGDVRRMVTPFVADRLQSKLFPEGFSRKEDK